MKNLSIAPSTSPAMITTPSASPTLTRPAWREPMVWLMVGLPLTAVIAAFWLLAVAVRSGGADEVRDEVHSTAGMQVAETGPDARAQAMGLIAVLSVGEGRVRVFPAQGDFARDQPLVLVLSHPVDAHRDRRLILQPDATGWDLTGDLRDGHDWIAQLAPPDGRWRIRGRLRAGQQAARLAPDLGGD
jgi:hypothetical protein